jgi:hypothetical protein
MTHLQRALLHHPRLDRAACLVTLLVLAACQPDSNGGEAPGGDGY